MTLDRDTGGVGTAQNRDVEIATRTMRLRLPSELRAGLIGWARSGYPVETCGLLIGESGRKESTVLEVRLAENLERHQAESRYVLDPVALLHADREARETGLEVLGFWHSHPDSPAVPSDTDRARAWEGYAYVIVSVGADRAPDARVWSLENGTFQEGEIVE